MRKLLFYKGQEISETISLGFNISKKQTKYCPSFCLAHGPPKDRPCLASRIGKLMQINIHTYWGGILHNKMPLLFLYDPFSRLLED